MNKKVYVKLYNIERNKWWVDHGRVKKFVDRESNLIEIQLYEHVKISNK